MKTMLVTGGGRGLGRATAVKLAKGGARVILTARTPEAATLAALELCEANPEAKVEGRGVDLSSLKSIRTFAQGLLDESIALDVVFNIAGLMPTNPERRQSKDGFEETLAVNALAPFLLTRMLIPALERTEAARVINVSSRLHLPDSRGKPVRFDFDDPQLERGYDPDRAYKNSKLAVLWFTYELQRRLEGTGITANAVCPGFVPVTAAESTHGAMHWMMKHVMPHMPFATSVEAATDSLVFMATDPSLQGIGGRFFGEQKPIASSPESLDTDKALRFWRLASSLTGLPDDWRLGPRAAVAPASGV